MRPLIAVLAFMIGLAATLGSCSAPERTQQLGQLEALLSRLDSAELAYNDKPLERGILVKRACDSLLQAVDMALLGREVTRSTAEPFNGLSTCRRLLKDQGIRQRRIAQELSRTRSQVTLLSEAIRTRARHDAQGTPIDADYLKRAQSDESRIAEHLIAEMAATSDLLHRGLVEFDAVEVAVTSWLDSTNTVHRANPDPRNAP